MEHFVGADLHKRVTQLAPLRPELRFRLYPRLPPGGFRSKFAFPVSRPFVCGCCNISTIPPVRTIPGLPGSHREVESEGPEEISARGYGPSGTLTRLRRVLPGTHFAPLRLLARLAQISVTLILSHRAITRENEISRVTRCSFPRMPSRRPRRVHLLLSRLFPQMAAVFPI